MDDRETLFREWLAEHRGAVLKVARAYTVTPEDCQDLTQEILLQCSLAEVEHQIRLLRNVVWWYLLPLGIPMLAFFVQTFWQKSRGDVWEAAIATSFVTVVVGGVFAWVYWLNRKAVRAVLEPRRQELAAMLNSLSDEPPSTLQT